MVIHMVAREVRKRRRFQFHPVEPVLVQPVAGRLHTRIIDFLFHEVGQQPVQQHRVGRRARIGIEHLPRPR